MKHLVTVASISCVNRMKGVCLMQVSVIPKMDKVNNYLITARAVVEEARTSANPSFAIEKMVEAQASISAAQTELASIDSRLDSIVEHNSNWPNGAWRIVREED